MGGEAVKDVGLSGPGVSGPLRSCSCIYKETVILCEIPEVQSLIWKELGPIIRRSVMARRIVGRATKMCRSPPWLNLYHTVGLGC